jgi:hypothetical protein
MRPKLNTSRFDRTASSNSPPGYCANKPAIPPTVRTKPISFWGPALPADKERHERSKTGQGASPTKKLTASSAHML